MNQEELSDYLTELRNNGYDYDYIQGFEDGYNSTEPIDEEEERNSGTSYAYIEGFKDGYDHF